MALGAPSRPTTETARERVRAIHGIDNCTTRRNILAGKLYSRVQDTLSTARERADPEEVMWRTIEMRAILETHHQSDITLPNRVQHARRVKTELRRKSRINTTDEHVHPSLLLRRRALARCMIAYHTGRWLFPKRVAELSSIYGEDDTNRWRTRLRVLTPKTTLTAANRSELVEIIHKCTDDLPNPWRNRALAQEWYHLKVPPQQPAHRNDHPPTTTESHGNDGTIQHHALTV